MRFLHKFKTMNKYLTQENKSQLLTTLQFYNVTITFKKINGEIRIMNCTLCKNVIPLASKEDPLSQKKIRDISPEVLTVWDIDKKDWRSIRWINIVKVEHEQIKRIDTGST